MSSCMVDYQPFIAVNGRLSIRTRVGRLDPRPTLPGPPRTEGADVRRPSSSDRRAPRAQRPGSEPAHPARDRALGARAFRPANGSRSPPRSRPRAPCVMHMATRIRPDIPMLFLGDRLPVRRDARVQAASWPSALGLNVVDLIGEHTVGATAGRVIGPRLYERDPERCCDLNKVQPMFEALRGLRRVDHRVPAGIVTDPRRRRRSCEQYELEPGSLDREGEPDGRRGRCRDVWAYLKEHDLPHNPLYDLGYSSIGCAPCTRMRFAGRAGARAGRWAGLSKWECGIQVTPALDPSGRERAKPGLGHDPEGLGRELELSRRRVVAERVAVDLHRERRLRRRSSTWLASCDVVDVATGDVAGRAEHLPRDARDASAARASAPTGRRALSRATPPGVIRRPRSL